MTFFNILLAVVLGLGLGWIMVRSNSTDYSRIHIINRDDFTKNMRKGQLIDIRKQDQFEADKIKGARNYKTAELTGKYAKIRKDLPIYLYCNNGKKSKRIAKSLARKNFKVIYVLEGGLQNFNNPK